MCSSVSNFPLKNNFTWHFSVRYGVLGTAYIAGYNAADILCADGPVQYMHGQENMDEFDVAPRHNNM